MALADRSFRSKAAIAAGRAVATASKIANLGSGSVIGGRVSLAIDADLLATLARGREIALVSATNGKTTTAHLLATALVRNGPVVSNSLGANMPPGLVAALGEGDPAARAVLEVDERWLPKVMTAVGPSTVLLLNLSRDQLDRSHEVRKVADLWRDAMGDIPVKRVVANADDPLIVWAASSARKVVWVGTAAHWTNDAAGCPKCGGRIAFGSPLTGEDNTDGADHWNCTQCDFAKPDPEWWLSTGIDTADTADPATGAYAVQRRDGTRVALAMSLPGRVNAANAAVVIAAATEMGCDPHRTAIALGTVTDVAGRYRIAKFCGAELRMLLAKNPAGWQEAIEMLGPGLPVLASINARIADGRDPSWLWDVPFEAMRGRFVVAIGERRHDLAVRLRYAEVEHEIGESLAHAVSLAKERSGSNRVDLIANYTAFQDHLIEADASERGAST